MAAACPRWALKERIGKPELFTGRKEELDYLIDFIKGAEYEYTHEYVDTLCAETGTRKTFTG